MVTQASIPVSFMVLSTIASVGHTPTTTTFLKARYSTDNYVKFDGSITKGIMKGVTISLGSSAKMTSDFSIFKKSAAAYAVAKGYKYW